MSEDKEETAGLPLPKGAVGEPPAKPESNSDLPNIESPPLSPAGETGQAAPEPAIEPTDLVVFAPEVSSLRALALPATSQAHRAARGFGGARDRARRCCRCHGGQ